jgi:hypothetical protein
MPPVEEFDALFKRRLQVWTMAARTLGGDLGRVFAYADVACEVSSRELLLLSDPTLQHLEEVALFTHKYGSNLAHGLETTLDACKEDGVDRALLIASTMPNTAMDESGRPRQSFPTSEVEMGATRAAMAACAAGGLRVDTVTIAGFPDDRLWASPFTAERFLADITTRAGGSALTLQPHDGLSTLERTLTNWYG